MAAILDLNEISCSMLDITLRDKDRTVVHLDIPSEELVQQLEAMQPELDSLRTGDYSAVKKIYELAAKVINVNVDGFQVTAEELPQKYGMNILASLNFFGAYIDAVEALKNQKN